MTAPLPAGTRVKLAKALALLASDKPGEVQAAAAAATRIVQGAGLSWRQVLSPPPVDHPPPELGTWRETVRRCLARRGDLRPWEKTFLDDLPNFRRLSTKQRYCLKTIADRVLRREAQ